MLHHHRLAIDPSMPTGTASRFLGACLRQIRVDRPETWAVVTYADLCEGHDGIVYRATNAVSTGVVSAGELHFRDQDGRLQLTQSLPGTWPQRRQEAAGRGWTETRCRGKSRCVWLVGSARFKSKLRGELRWDAEPHSL